MGIYRDQDDNRVDLSTWAITIYGLFALCVLLVIVGVWMTQ